MEKQNDDTMLSVKEMSKLTGLSIYTIYQMIRKGNLPWDYFVVTPTKKVSHKSDVLTWIEKVRIKARV